MVCERCGGITIYDTKESREEYERIIRKCIGTLKDEDCKKLIEICTTSVMMWEVEAARRILKSRGHGTEKYELVGSEVKYG